jgi:Protein of unknown function (DUF3106)
MNRRSILGLALSVGLLAGMAAQPARAQQGERWRAWHEQRVAQNQKQGAVGGAHPNAGNNAGGGKGQQLNPRGAAGLPPRWVESLREMPPEQQERFLQNNARFQGLLPARQAQIRQNLAKWNRLTPEQKDRIRATEQMFEQMTPEQREHFRDELIPQLAQLPPERRQRVIGHWRRLQLMTPEEQQAALHDPRFMQGLSPDEQSMVRDLNSMGAPPPPQESTPEPAQ